MQADTADPAAIVPCPGKDVKCPWTGRRDLLAAHTSVCPHEALRPLLTDLLHRIADLEAHDKVSGACSPFVPFE